MANVFTCRTNRQGNTSVGLQEGGRVHVLPRCGAAAAASIHPRRRRRRRRFSQEGGGEKSQTPPFSNNTMEHKRHDTLPRGVLLTGFVVLILAGRTPTLAIDIYTEPEVMVENGTACVLRCTFKSNEVISSHVTVTWNFQSSQPDNQFSKAPYAIFYFYNGNAAPASKEFKDRVQFIGDINKRDVSIRLNPAQFSDNGTYFCDVKNPPDFTGTPARTELRVVSRESLPRSNMAVIVGSVCGVLALLVLVLVAACVVMKMLHNRHDYEGAR
ncbi:myelin protein zero-like 1 like isoform X2 [Vanacampus margaritifer]